MSNSVAVDGLMEKFAGIEAVSRVYEKTLAAQNWSQRPPRQIRVA